MFPLKDNVPHRRFPVMNVSIIIFNFIIFLYQTQLPREELHQFIANYSVVPLEQVQGMQLLFQQPALALYLGSQLLFPYISATFLHGSWMHLIGNMIYLWVFGDNIEDRLGPLRYLAVYLLMGVVGHLFHLASAPFSQVPLIGASGAIAGVLGAYFVLYPRARVLTLVPLGFFITFIYIPAFLFLALWFLLQLFNAITPAAPAGAQSVAWWAHVGGFFSGVIMGAFMSRQLPNN